MEFIKKTIATLLISQVILIASAGKIFSCTEKNTIALTFDDGPFEYTEELINKLQESDIKATFFINVENYWKDLETSKSKQAVIKKAFDNGHQIASHTWMHEIPDDHEEFIEMMNKTNQWIESVIGEKPAYFRAPGGKCNEDCVAELDDMGYKTIQWDTDTNDWDRSVGVEERVEMVKDFLTEEWEYKRSNYLILMHDVQEHTVESIVPWILKNKPEGYRYVTVAECLGHKESMYLSGRVVGNDTTLNNTSIVKGNDTSNIVKDDNQGHLMIDDKSAAVPTLASILTTHFGIILWSVVLMMLYFI